ncbi:YceI family protein [Psychroserpens damuponensis]|uniref:YceI family protein n=1 Tax=Psychroserpens damuponensis TaxID=943936 RepID=UPI00137916A2|nr:YceI family protein [Psychroserpens damuponensis]
MKTKILVLLAVVGMLTFGNAQEKLAINVEKSNIKWSGEYTFYFGGHHGTIDFKDGYFIKTNDVISGGEFTIDMNSIICLDIEDDEPNESLVNHLKDPDFFDVTNFETAKLIITSVKYHDAVTMKIYADLTIRGITNPISFQAKVNYDDTTMTTKFKIDRMLWGINYNSKMKDGAISDAIGFEVTLSL